MARISLRHDTNDGPRLAKRIDERIGATIRKPSTVPDLGAQANLVIDQRRA
ncbi:hypothetical protein [Novosphingobium sp. FKTRR1]|uniref:hypothetical protein n=1 Tax=Novosphingobium sp. FKTRR1 TaxID=2879118 RepID=UPI001CF01E44|nr:hypothetical protein [Novosphingobium sp. FKTRR1]